VCNKMENFLATGNLISRTNLDMMQTSGFTIVADKLNQMRYLSHFRSLHRGSYFAEMKTTTVRKLLPEAWGFVCPVHTPDGAPCGLLNHISLGCIPLPCDPTNFNPEEFIKSLLSNGMIPLNIKSEQELLPVMLDGRHIGNIAACDAEEIVRKLRILKISRKDPGIPASLEIGYIPPTEKFHNSHHNMQWPGIFFATTPS